MITIKILQKVSLDDKFAKAHRDINKKTIYFLGIPIFSRTRAFTANFVKWAEVNKTNYMANDVGFKK
jgi:hypothetical protein